MPGLIPLALFYDPEKRTWFFSSEEQAAASPLRTLYWGVPPVPITMLALRGRQAPPGALPMTALMAPGSRAVVGPLIGILSAENRDGSLKGNFANYKALMETGQKVGGIVFAFTPSGVDWGSHIIRGNIFDRKSNRWVTYPFPFPNVVYNRIQDRRHESKKSCQACIQRFLACPGLTLYNRGFFNKKEVIATLSRSPAIRKHIPDTNMLLSLADLANALKHHPAVYLKPTHSRLGSGIMRVTRPPQQKPYTMHYYAGDKQLKKYRALNIVQLWSKIRQEMVGSPYLVQKAVPLAAVSACPFDCRVLVQKNRRGRWQISGLGIRVAGHSKSITTHVPRGGHIDAPASVLQQAFPHHHPARLEKRVKRLSLAAAKKMEKHHQPLGEMSLDIGLDRQGYPWIFEANAKPMKFDEPAIRENQLEQVIHYAQYLTFGGASF